jgi:hypothetical protein
MFLRQLSIRKMDEESFLFELKEYFSERYNVEAPLASEMALDLFEVFSTSHHSLNEVRNLLKH